jgi:N-acetylmuramoyl-L-alanine amidase
MVTRNGVAGFIEEAVPPKPGVTRSKSSVGNRIRILRFEFGRFTGKFRAVMRVVMWLGLLWAGVPVAGGSVSADRLERVALFGTEYVRLDDWARTRNFQLRWTVPKQELKLTGPAATLAFTVDSRRITINGIHVWISAPIAFRNGSAYIPPVDLETAIQPLLSPSRNPPGRTITSICLDPGHGGKDPGRLAGRQQEKKFTLLLARELSEQLTRAGFKVSLTRKDDNFVELPVRPEMARRRSADLFLSLHFNSADGAGGSAVRGVEVYCMTPARTSSTNARGEGAGAGSYPGNRFDSKNILLAYQLQQALVGRLGLEDRGVRRARFAVLRSAEMPAVLIEGGFMTNPAEANKIYDANYRRQTARTIVDGVLAYKRMVEQ